MIKNKNKQKKQFRVCVPGQLEAVWTELPALFPSGHILLNEKGGNKGLQSGRKDRGPQVAEANKLLVADIFSPLSSWD